MNAAISFPNNASDDHQYSTCSFYQPSEAEPLSSFAQTLRETDEEFYATFPQARAAKQAEIEAQLNHGYFGGGCYYQAPSADTSTTSSYQSPPPCDSMRVEHPPLYYNYTGFESTVIHPTRPSLPPQNFDLQQSTRPKRPEPYQSYVSSSRPLESNTYSQVNQLPSPIQSQHYYPPPPPPMPPCCNCEPLMMDFLVSSPIPASAFPAHVQTMPTAMEVHPTSQYHMVAEPTPHWSNRTEEMLPALPAPAPRYHAVQEPIARVTSSNHPQPVRARHAQHQSTYQAYAPSHYPLAGPSHRSTSPRPLMPLPIRRPVEKKPPLACLFCRGRKIACGPPIPGSKDKTCNQCQRRSLKCEYPSESRRGMRKKKTAHVNINTNGPKVTLAKSEP